MIVHLATVGKLGNGYMDISRRLGQRSAWYQNGFMEVRHSRGLKP